MKRRLTKIVTKTGDKGMTRMADGVRLLKSDLRVQVIGEVDELNSLLGVVLAHYEKQDEYSAIVNQIQNDLFDLGAELTFPEKTVINEKYTERLEKYIDELLKELPDLVEFILPGGTKASAHCHVARAVCRRVERKLVLLIQEAESLNHLVPYLNRLSDLLFVLARTFNRLAGKTEPQWQHDRQ
jgi:cob(I)alamin adenosyltransferase